MAMLFHQGPLSYNNSCPREVKLDELFKSNPALGGFVQRCKAAHENGMENLVLLSSVIILAVVFKVPAKELNPLIVTFLVSRLAFTFVYMICINNAVGYVRSALYFGSIAALGQIVHLTYVKA